MDKSSTKECVDCKPGDNTRHKSAVQQTGCEDLYEKVDGTSIYILDVLLKFLSE